MDEPNKNCDCYTLQAAGTKPVIIHDPVVTLGLVAVFMLIVTGLVCVILVRWHRNGRPRRLW